MGAFFGHYWFVLLIILIVIICLFFLLCFCCSFAAYTASVLLSTLISFGLSSLGVDHQTIWGLSLAITGLLFFFFFFLLLLLFVFFLLCFCCSFVAYTASVLLSTLISFGLSSLGVDHQTIWGLSLAITGLFFYSYSYCYRLSLLCLFLLFSFLFFSFPFFFFIFFLFFFFFFFLDFPLWGLTRQFGLRILF